MYVRMLPDVGHVSQYSKINFRIWGMKASCPFDGAERRDARNKGLVGATKILRDIGRCGTES
jgi:hypothetical protein